MLERIKDTISDFFYNVRSAVRIDELFDMIPPVVTETAKGVVFPLVMVIVIIVAYTYSSGARNSGSTISASVSEFQEDIGLVEGTFNGEYEFLTDEDDEALNRADLVIQYTALSNADSGDVFTNMEATAVCTEEEEETVRASAVSEYAEKIVEFAGWYGGALIENTFSTLKLAAYETSGEMTAPDDGVSNVLVQHFTKTIEAELYGEQDTEHTFIVMSGTDITNISSVTEGSFMYTYLGDSNSDSRYKNTYVCVGVETGYLETYEIENEAAASAGSVAQTLSDGTIIYSDGTIVSPDGTVTYSDGTVVSSDGTVTYSDGMTVSPDGTVSGGSSDSDDDSSDDEDTDGEDEEDEEYDSSSASSESASASSGDEITIKIRDNSSSSSSSSGSTSSSSTGSGSSSSSADDDDDEEIEDEELEPGDDTDSEEDDTQEDADDESEETSEDADEESEEEDAEITDYDFGEDSELGQNVYAADGTLITDNEENDLVLYSINSKTKTVRITYWNEAS